MPLLIPHTHAGLELCPATVPHSGLPSMSPSGRPLCSVLRFQTLCYSVVLSPASVRLTCGTALAPRGFLPSFTTKPIPAPHLRHLHRLPALGLLRQAGRTGPGSPPSSLRQVLSSRPCCFEAALPFLSSPVPCSCPTASTTCRFCSTSFHISRHPPPWSKTTRLLLRGVCTFVPQSYLTQ